MSVLIEKYRGWDIYFEPSNEGFYVESDEWDQKKAKRSFFSCKTFVDDYLKENNQFKPIRAQHIENGNILLLTGIRNDGLFTYEKDGKKHQLSKYDLSHYIKYDPSNDPKYEAIKKWESEISKCREEIRKIRSGITGVSLKEISQNLIKP